jgi:hypothetical protein
MTAQAAQQQAAALVLTMVALVVGNTATARALSHRNVPKGVWTDKMKAKVPLIILSVLFVTAAQSSKITPRQAKDHVGEVQTVCGKVVSTRHAATSKGEPTFLNLDEPYPKQIFTIVIWGSDRPKFGDPEKKYRDSQVCVTGKITSYRETPETTATEPSQITLQK